MGLFHLAPDPGCRRGAKAGLGEAGGGTRCACQSLLLCHDYRFWFGEHFTNAPPSACLHLSFHRDPDGIKAVDLNKVFTVEPVQN